MHMFSSFGRFLETSNFFTLLDNRIRILIKVLLPPVSVIEDDMKDTRSSSSGSDDGSDQSESCLRDVIAIAAIQGHTQIFLNKYIHTIYPTQPTRFCKIQLILPKLKSIPSLVLEELFFRNIIGHNTTIKKTIWHMYKNAGLWGSIWRLLLRLCKYFTICWSNLIFQCQYVRKI